MNSDEGMLKFKEFADKIAEDFRIGVEAFDITSESAKEIGLRNFESMDALAQQCLEDEITDGSDFVYNIWSNISSEVGPVLGSPSSSYRDVRRVEAMATSSGFEALGSLLRTTASAAFPEEDAANLRELMEGDTFECCSSPRTSACSWSAARLLRN